MMTMIVPSNLGQRRRRSTGVVGGRRVAAVVQLLLLALLLVLLLIGVVPILPITAAGATARSDTTTTTTTTEEEQDATEAVATTATATADSSPDPTPDLNNNLPKDHRDDDDYEVETERAAAAEDTTTTTTEAPECDVDEVDVDEDEEVDTTTSSATSTTTSTSASTTTTSRKQEEEEKTASRSSSTSSSRRSPSMPLMLDSLKRIKRVYHMDDLLHLQNILQEQQQQYMSSSSSSSTSSQKDDDIPNFVLWVILLLPDNQNCQDSSIKLWKQLEKYAHDWASQNIIYTGVLTKPVVEEEHKTFLKQQFHIQNLPSILLVTANMTHSFVVEYTFGESELQQFVSNYADTFTIGSEHFDQNNSYYYPSWTTDVMPRKFSNGWQELDNFLVEELQQDNNKRLLFAPRRQNHHRRPPVVVMSQHAKSHQAQRYDYIQWLMDSDDNTRHYHGLLIVQCRTNGGHAEEEEYDIFDRFAQTVLTRSDILLLAVEVDDDDDDEESSTTNYCRRVDNGNRKDGIVQVWHVPLLHNDTKKEKELFQTRTTPPQYTYPSVDDNDQNNNDQQLGLWSFLVHVSSSFDNGNTMWFDRQTTAPVLFAKFRKVHFVLFVEVVWSSSSDDNNNNSDSSSSSSWWEYDPQAKETKRAIVEFRNACCQYQYIHWDLACLIVPSTETRILNTLGITDRWTEFDNDYYTAAAATTDDDLSSSADDEEDQDSPTTTTSSSADVAASSSSPLPTVLITDQRQGPNIVKRYYLKDHNKGTNITNFLHAFWNDKLEPTIRSSSSSTTTLPHTTTESGVEILTAASSVLLLQQQQQEHHALMVFVAPTCGHCKRFLTIYNHLSKLLKHLGWNTLLKLYQMDVTEIDIAIFGNNVSIEWLPDLYYLPPSSSLSNLVRYDLVDELGDGAGAIEESTEILEWLIHHIGIFDDDASNHADNNNTLLRQLLTDLQELSTAT